MSRLNIKEAKASIRKLFSDAKFWYDRNNVKKYNTKGTLMLERKCETCKKIFSLPASEVLYAIKNGSVRGRFCSTKCRKPDPSYAENKHDYRNFIANEIRATKQQDALKLGTAGEHLVCAHLICLGYNAYLSNHFSKYDVIVDIGGKLIRIQVKTTTKSRNSSKSTTFHYMFYTSNYLNGKLRTYKKSDFDIYAFVALDIGVIAYMPISDKVSKVMSFRLPNTTSKKSVRLGNIDEYPFNIALKSIMSERKRNG